MNTRIWACTSAGACVASFVATTLPYLQYLAVLISIACGLRVWLKRDKT